MENDNTQNASTAGENFDLGENPVDILNPEPDATEKPETQESPKEDPEKAELKSRLEKLEDERASDAQVIQYLRGRADAKPTEKVEEKKEEPLLKLPDKATLAKALENSDTAVDAILNMFDQFGNSIIDRMSKLKTETDTRLTQRDLSERHRTALLRDIESANNEYGKDLLSSKDFQKEADVVLNEILTLRGDSSINDVRPGDYSAAAAKVYSRWLKAGKIKGETNGEVKGGERPTLREITRRVESEPSSNAPRNEGGNGAPKTIADLNLSPREERVARMSMQRLGIAEKDWVRNVVESQQDDPDYGK